MTRYRRHVIDAHNRNWPDDAAGLEVVVKCPGWKLRAELFSDSGQGVVFLLLAYAVKMTTLLPEIADRRRDMHVRKIRDTLRIVRIKPAAPLP